MTRDSSALDPSDFNAAKTMVQSPDPAVRRRVAEHPQARAELLYYLAADSAPEVRQAIATNAGTPRQADLLLAADADQHVRGSLARKVAGLVPDLPEGQFSQIEKMTVECLETLARDQATEVRTILADALKDLPNAPYAIINALARDVELSVCGPVLQHSPILTEEDLLDIIMMGPVAGALSAIAWRRDVSPSVADAIARSDDEAAVTALLANPSAQIREETLDRIIDDAPRHEPWHGPLVRRPKLPARAVARLASFVADNLLKVLQQRDDLDPEAARRLAEAVRERVASGEVKPRGGPVDLWADEVVEEKPAERPTDRAARLNKDGKLTEKLLDGSLSEGDRAFAMAGLGELAGVPLGTVDRIITTHSPRAVIALVWRAGLSMRFAKQVQLRLAQIPPKSALNARDGVHFPMSEDEMRWQLEFFGVEDKK
ncbi:DUF2336 domain-containing protein [Azospirillum sp. TSO22-1]|uniref:DUF2336 domain-containing protein n=1 Tax=Azospirillum sp. TSO22-1 TaxID=716789 RepID=UPI000D61135B|nr:DUF2336 domain-containing protein [Azospirillum sp. TSO22-1]PWC43522.1 hypothetical protein TSO221_19370 [Azospirillum sp. TSO22-1]